MNTRDVSLPDIGEGVTEAEIVEWHVGVGDRVVEDQIIGAVMTDKAAVDIPSPVAGVIVSLGGEVGDVLAVGAALARIDVGEERPAVIEGPDGKEGRADGGASGGAEAMREAEVKDDATGETGTEGEGSAPGKAGTESEGRTTGEGGVEGGSGAEGGSSATGESDEGIEGVGSGGHDGVGEGSRSEPHRKALAAPAVRRRARELGIALHDVPGSGADGRITHADLDRHLLDGSAVATGSSSRVDTVEKIRVVGLRRRIARQMEIASRRIPHFSYIEELDVTELEALRRTLADDGERPPLSPLPFIVMAVVRSLEAFPGMNARYDDEAGVVHRHGGRHVGIATQTANGLMVPVVRHAESLDIHALAAEIGRLAEACRGGRITRKELEGGTITVTSLGALGGLASTPIINHPEVAIIGVNRIVGRAVCRGERIVQRRMMNLSSSFDHRVIDGHDAARFVRRIRACLECPATLFMRA